MQLKLKKKRCFVNITSKMNEKKHWVQTNFSMSLNDIYSLE